MPDPVFQPPSVAEQSVNPDLTTDVVADVSIPADAANLNMAGGPYLAWGQVTKMTRTTGTVVQNAGDPNDVNFLGDAIYPSRGRVEKVVTGVAVRAGDEPALPEPEPDTDTMKLLDSESAYFSPSVLPDGATRAYGVVWRYRYSFTTVPQPGATVLWGNAPFDLGSATPVNPNDFLDWLVGKQ